jgi:hypothetical protein
VRNEPIENLPQGCKRSERFGPIAACVDDLHGRAVMLARLRG